ncbi:MAG: TIGR02206 family membrane protein [Bacteroidales bacterium]|jgi:hypothetical integral membrane protein (TIGR02206 family)|nr:TIGR02206 family membrane protein [Bacteroidales bacterium]
MFKFFDPTEYSEIRIPMYGLIHLITILGMLILILIVFWRRDSVKRLASNRRFVVSFVSVYLGIELFYWILLWAYRVEPVYDRFPLHLCASLSLLMPILILKEKYNLLRFFSYWSISAGFISFANPGFVFQDPWSFAFIHYLIRHYLLFFIPIILQIGRDYQHNYREFTISWVSLGVWAFVIFLLDWATGANYMHLGQNNPLEIPFLPASFTVWPWTFPSFVGVGIILLHLAYLSFTRMHKGKRFEKALM